MAKLINKYAASLLELARKKGKLEEFYKGAIPYAEKDLVVGKEMPEELEHFLRHMMNDEIKPVIHRFLELAREELHILDVEVVSAVPLKPEQLAKLEYSIIGLAKKQVTLHNTVDHSIIGGLRIIIGNMVIDNSIKTQLSSMKEELYKGVYFNDED